LLVLSVIGMMAKKRHCHFMNGHDEYKCIAGEFFRGAPQCYRCWYEDGREDCYMPSFFLRCPVCGSARNHGELICYTCQFVVLFLYQYIVIDQKPE